MKKILIIGPLMVFVLFNQILLANELVIDSLEGGTCWSSYFEGQYQLADFKNGFASKFSKKHFNQVNKQILERLGQGEDSELFHSLYEVYLQCRSDGAFLFFNFFEGDKKLCAHVDVMINSGGDFELSLSNIYPNHEQKNGLCQGQNPGVLILNFGLIGPEHNKCLEDIEKMESVESIQALSHSGIKLNLIKSVYFKENYIKNEILELPSCKEYLSYWNVEYDSIFLPAGDSVIVTDMYFEF